MEFALAETRALEVFFTATDFTPATTSEPPSVDKFRLTFNINFQESAPKEFAVIYNCFVQVEKLREMRVTYLARFETSDPVNEEFRTSHFVHMNSPAIGYPYMRAFVGQVLLLSGYKPVTLPTINFKLLYDNKQVEAKTLVESSHLAPSGVPIPKESAELAP
jgi:preprotein translocase subunit SecB